MNSARDTIIAPKLHVSSVAGVGGWQPIETAPKDGTEVLLWVGDGCEVGFWGDTLQDGMGWTEGRDLMPLPATHWMPLPSPPSD